MNTTCPMSPTPRPRLRRAERAVQQSEAVLHSNDREAGILRRRLIAAQESERRRLARELHDNLGQKLALLCLEIESLGAHTGVVPAALAEAIAGLSERVRDIIGQEKYFMYQGIFDTDFDKYTEDAIQLFTATGVDTVFEKLEGFPADWKTNAPAFIKFVREHQCPSFLEYGEYPYVSAVEIKKAPALKQAFSSCSTTCSEGH
jgi:histidine kinase